MIYQTQTQTAETPIAEVTTLPRPSGPTPPAPPAPAPDTRVQAYHYKVQREPAMSVQDSALYYLGSWVQALVMGHEKPMHRTMTQKYLNQLIDDKLSILRD